MRLIRKTIILLSCLMLNACSVKNPITNQYKLDSYSHKVIGKHSPVSILVSQPDAVAGYQTEQMLYMKKPYAIHSFVHNAWISPPAGMLFPLLIQSLQATEFFHTVATPPYADNADYRLDTQLLEMQQNFISKPSHIEFVAKITLTAVNDEQVIGSKIIREKITCPADNPYGGVIAANKAALLFTASVTEFVIKHIQRYRA